MSIFFFIVQHIYYFHYYFPRPSFFEEPFSKFWYWGVERGMNQLLTWNAFYQLTNWLYFQDSESFSSTTHHLEHTMLIDAEYTIGSNKWPHSCLGTEMQLSDLIKSIVIYCKCVSMLWTLFFLHKWEKWGHILRRKKKINKISTCFPEEILQEILGLLLQCSWVCHYWCRIKKSFPAYFLWEGAVHVDPLILMCIPPVLLESFGSSTDQLWL